MDIREKASAGPEDILALNFIRATPSCVFRRHHRQGLRSHILEVLDPKDLRAERDGVMEDGVLRFPRARPVRMFRVFRARFRSPAEGLEETRRVKLVERFLAPEHMARSEEFLVDYRFEGRQDSMLCGLQEYVEGEPLDPWSPIRTDLLQELAQRMRADEPNPSAPASELTLTDLRNRASSFVERVKRMIRETGYIPDLAGIHNLILTPEGFVKLVDINNISPLALNRDIFLDDKGYPICDKSVQALANLEEKLLARPPDPADPLYGHFLSKRRVRKVQTLEETFHRNAR